MELEWKILPRGDVAPHWSGLYVTMTARGAIAMSRVTHERFGTPEAVLIMYDAMHCCSRSNRRNREIEMHIRSATTAAAVQRSSGRIGC